MQKASKISFVLGILIWLVALFALVIVILATTLIPAGYNYVSIFQEEGNGWLLPVWIASMVALLAAFILCKVFKKQENLSLIPLSIGLLAGVAALVVALELKNLLPVQVGLQYDEQGINDWRLVWRHLTPVAAGLFVAVSAWLNRRVCRDERIAAENAAYTDHYDLSGDPVFSDGDSTIGLDTYAEDFGIKKPGHRLKRSLRRKKNK